jgi:hypothetical protein
MGYSVIIAERPGTLRLPMPNKASKTTKSTPITEIAQGVFWGREDDGYFSGERFVFIFNLGSAKLTPGQLKIISQHVVPCMTPADAWSEFYGSTDRSGSADFNLKLSEQRLWEFQVALMQAGGPMDMVFGSQHKFFGENFAAEVLMEQDDSYDPYERAVTAYFWPDKQSSQRIFANKKLLIYGRSHPQP